MTDPERLARRHTEVTRRYFLKFGAAGLAAMHMSPVWAREDASRSALQEAIARLEYLTPPDKFRFFGRGKPPPHTLPADRLREVGLTRETWQLEVIADPASDAKVAAPLAKETGNALDWAGLMKLAERHAVRYMQVMSCTNAGRPLGMGLWEGVPLRDVIWLARPTGNVRRVFYYGFHNDDPKQRFQSSLAIGRALEDPPGEHPVILCYKLNGQWLSAKGGGPVRILVPNAYGNKSVKWLQRIVLTNEPKANDTYAQWNNDTESALKTCALFVHVPKRAKVGQPAPVTGMVQVGMSGLRKVQYWLQPAEAEPPKDDPYFTRADWKEATILPPPENWGGGLPNGKLPPIPLQFDVATGKSHQWPMHNTIAHWAVLLPGLRAGRYHLRCRSIDAKGIAQPMPRPFPKSGRNAIQCVVLQVDV